MKTDEYLEIINGLETYNAIALLLMESPVLIGWTDQEGTHVDILFSFNAFTKAGNTIQRGITGDDLFISVMGRGSFGFELVQNPNTFSGYYAEKLNLEGFGSTMGKLTDLFNGVRSALWSFSNDRQNP